MSREELRMRREELQAKYAEGEKMMTEASDALKEIGVYAASPQQLRADVADYLARVAAIVRSGAEDPDEVLRLAGTPVPAKPGPHPQAVT